MVVRMLNADTRMAACGACPLSPFPFVPARGPPLSPTPPHPEDTPHQEGKRGWAASHNPRAGEARPTKWVGSLRHLLAERGVGGVDVNRKSTRLNSRHVR